MFIRLATAISVVTTCLLVGGSLYGAYAALGYSVGGLSPTAVNAPPTTASGNSSGSGTSPTVIPSAKLIHLVALGDSLTHGLGDASGRGYVGDVSQLYRQHQYQVIQSNLGIDGLTSSGLRTELQQSEVVNLLHSADVILISIGGNDLSNAAGLPNIQLSRIAMARKAFTINLTAILTTIRRVNPTATIAIVGLYNPFLDIPKSLKETNAEVASWDLNENSIAAQFPGVVVVQTYDLFQLHPTEFLYLDNFHPNQAGYSRIATRVWQDLQS